MIFNTTGGGAALNFRVVGNPQPANPTENCIWVDTDTPITSWIFSATQPSPAEPGMIWITIGTSSNVEFNALKKHGLQVYPISAKQWVNGALVGKTAKSYQGGEWVEWITDLFILKQGVNTDDITGGWNGQTVSMNVDGTTLISRPGSSGGDYCTKTNNAIDITDYKTMVVEVTSITTTTVNTSVDIGFTKTGNTDAVVSISSTGTYTLDISAMSGEYYAAAFVANGLTVHIKNMKLTR